MRIRTLVIIAYCWLLAWQASAFAALDLVLTQGIAGALPIAIVPFTGQALATTDIASIIQADLRNSGRFSILEKLPATPHESSAVESSIWRKAGVDSVVVGEMQAQGPDSFHVKFNLVDVYKADSGSALLKQEFTVNRSELRRLAHHISDLIYQQLTGIRGIFSTRIAYIVVKHHDNGTQFVLEVADADGYNPHAIVTSAEPIMSPAWSHDGKRIAYVSFENRRAQIFISTLATGERHLLTSYPGINGAPAWSPDDNKLAIVLSKGGSPNIYSLDLNTNRLQALTEGNNVINTEPNWAPDGQSLVFTSDRGGSPQIYRLGLTDRHIERLTFDGNYNAHASYTPDGQRLVLLHRGNGMFVVAVQDLQKGRLQSLTSSGRDESPSLSANATMVLYGSEFGKLGMVSIDGRVKLRLPARDGDVKEPVWSPFLSD